MREIRMLRTTWRKLETGSRTGLRHRSMAKASGQQQLPGPPATAPVFDPTGERRLETGPRRGVRHRHSESCRQQLPPLPTATAPVADSTRFGLLPNSADYRHFVNWGIREWLRERVRPT